MSFFFIDPPKSGILAVLKTSFIKNNNNKTSFILFTYIVLTVHYRKMKYAVICSLCQRKKDNEYEIT